MANLLDISIENKPQEAQAAISSQQKNSESKNANSLFDSLLSSAIKNIDNKESKTSNVKVVSQENINVGFNKIFTPQEQEVNSINENIKSSLLQEETKENKEETKPSSNKIETKENLDKTTQSLLDKLVIQAKDKIQNEQTKSSNENLQVETNKVTSEETVVAPKEVLKTLEEKQNNLLQEETKENKEETKPSSNKIETKENLDKTTQSLLDKLVIQAKDKIQNEQTKSSNENLQVETNKVTSEETVVAPKEVLKTLEEKQNNLLQEETKENKEETKPSSNKIETKEKFLAFDIKNEKTNISENKTIHEEIKNNLKNPILENEKIDSSKTNFISDDKLSQDKVNIFDEDVNLGEDSNEVDLNNSKLNNNTSFKSNLKNKTQIKTQTPKDLDEYLAQNASKDNILTTKNDSKRTIISHKNDPAKDMVVSIYFGEQKHTILNQFLLNKNEAMKILEGNSLTIEDVNTSSDMLDLEASDASFEQNGTILKDEISTKQNKERQVLLDNILNEKNVRSFDIKNLITQSVEASKALLENTINITSDTTVDINPSLANNIQARIIGAKQHMSQMMSDIARQMYDNYKPPVTVFKINLNPAQLGSISVLMKNDRSTNSININMGISSLSTLDTILDNQNMLRNSLSKAFNDGTDFNLDFSSSNQNERQNNNNNDSSGGRNNQKEARIDTKSILKEKEENSKRENSVDYL